MEGPFVTSTMTFLGLARMLLASKVYFELSDYSTSYIFYDNPS